jgi:hypothetical protein
MNLDLFLKRAKNPIYLTLTETQKQQLKDVLESIMPLTQQIRYKIIPEFIKYNVNDNWVQRIGIVYNKKATLLEKYLARYGEDYGKVKYKQDIFLKGHSKEVYIFKYGQTEGIRKYNEFCNRKKGQATLDFFIKKYGEKEGKIKWDSYQQKRKESYQKRKESGLKQSNGRTIEEYIKKYGEKEGLHKWHERNQKQKYRFSKQYYINKYGVVDGELKWAEYCKSMDRGSLNYFIKKYGEQEGLKRYNIKCSHCRHGGMGLDACIQKYGEQEGYRRYIEWCEKTALAKKNSIHYSKISQKLFWDIYENLPEDLKNKCLFAELNEEQMFKIWKDGLTVIFVDFKIGNCIIEFHGTYWHSFKEVQEKDKLRVKHLQNRGYSILEVTQEEYLKDNLNTLLKCLNFIKENYKP